MLASNRKRPSWRLTTPINAIPNKQRANSLEKIVCALEKAIIGPKRPSSGNQPIKRSSKTLSHRYLFGLLILHLFLWFLHFFFYETRSNSYQPSSVGRVIIAGNKPASLFLLLTGIPAGKVMSILNADGLKSKKSKSSAGQETASYYGINVL